VLIANAALVVVFAGINTLVVTGDPAPQVTRVQIVKG
jgi:hypothetical protein